MVPLLAQVLRVVSSRPVALLVNLMVVWLRLARPQVVPMVAQPVVLMVAVVVLVHRRFRSPRHTVMLRRQMVVPVSPAVLPLLLVRLVLLALLPRLPFRLAVHSPLAVIRAAVRRLP